MAGGKCRMYVGREEEKHEAEVVG
jgi:hypothetical protein